MASSTAAAANVLELGDKYLTQLPGSFCGVPGVADAMLRWAAAALHVRDVPAAKAALLLLSHAVTPEGGPVRANATAAVRGAVRG